MWLCGVLVCVSGEKGVVCDGLMILAYLVMVNLSKLRWLGCMHFWCIKWTGDFLSFTIVRRWRCSGACIFLCIKRTWELVVWVRRRFFGRRQNRSNFFCGDRA